MVRILPENELWKLAAKLPPRLGVRWPSTSGRDDDEGEQRARDKGDAGRIAVVGGSEESTGAPYLAAMTALRCGADVVHVFCPPAAAQVIKGYSPDLMVHPCDWTADDKDSCLNVWLPWMDAIVVGPGIGRSDDAKLAVERTLKLATKIDTPVVVDADALYFVSLNPQLVKECVRAILTPNKRELSRLYDPISDLQLLEAFDNDRSKLENASVAMRVSKVLNGTAVLSKGDVDTISDAFAPSEDDYWEGTCSSLTSPRRCAGQGAILAGAVAVFAFWGEEHGRRNPQSEYDPDDGLQGYPQGFYVDACYGAALLTRHAAHAAFVRCSRSMTANDVVAQIGSSFKELFPPDGHTPSDDFESTFCELE